MGKLLSIKIKPEVKKLYDIEVKDNHNFVANGIVVKNSEQYLSRESLCILSSENVGKFSVDEKEYEKQQEKIAYSMNRFLDNVNTMEVKDNTYATPLQRIAIEKLRRTGAGVTNIAGWLFKKNLEYGSDEGNKAVSKFIERFNYYLYKSSIELGKEKGNFGLFNRDKFEKSPFVKRMMKLGLEFTYMRNCTCSSIAPVGTLSLMFRDFVFSYGIEPAFGIYFWKRTRMAGRYEYYFCVPEVVKTIFKQHGLEVPMKGYTIKDTWDGKHGVPVAKFIDDNIHKLEIKFKKPTEITYLEKLNLMSDVMKHVDSSISVTYMLPENLNWKDVYTFILEAHKKEIKSIAAFPDKKMYGIVSDISFKNLAIKLFNENVSIDKQNFSDEELKEISIITKKPIDSTIESISKTTAPKRPYELPCDIHHITVTKKLDKVRVFDYIVAVGLYGGNDPYEVFVMENGTIDKNIIKGTLLKVKSGSYSLKLSNGEIIDDITKNTTESEDTLTRLVSMGLRHGADIVYIIDQLEKVRNVESGIEMYSFNKVLARALKKYIPDGRANGIKCKKCGSKNMKMEDGCRVCLDCSYSACS